MERDDSLQAYLYAMLYLFGGVDLSHTNDQTVKVISKVEGDKTNKIVYHPSFFDEMHSYK
ncbi:hypothetical protein SAMN05216389_1427 [Oceanobacillus limi]|uniref:Uncharacterized protein n=1 Tax=Oceanobacillus limi TaxID=930131 RepID=A0A1I0HNM6_9BACI|nr:hypothetical protein [Oceanobacillus limi]SET85594.1 hypothetical protein SAMN05216389_1427 [Oceanobacillus limi]